MSLRLESNNFISIVCFLCIEAVLLPLLLTLILSENPHPYYTQEFAALLAAISFKRSQVYRDS
jgi:hypothetical protein